MAAIADRLSRDEALSVADVDALETLLGEPFDDAARRTLASDTALAMSELGTRLIERLVDRHGTGRIMFRNTRAAVGGFPGRVLHRHALDDRSPDALVGWLIEFLSERFPDKVLLICSEAETVETLAEALRLAGLQTARFHEGMSIVERDRAAAFFADPEESCRLLLCSEIGSEGRNFQFLHHLVTIDLPISPDLLEQRIGRLDRIGQAEVVQVHVPSAPDSRDDALTRWYDEGLDAFERITRTGAAIEAELGERVGTVAREAEEGVLDEKALNALIADTRTLSERLDAALESGRDRLLELNSNRPERVQVELDELGRLERDYRLQDFMEAVFDRFGVEVVEQRDHWIIQPGDHMQVASFPHLPEDGTSVTFERSAALEREELGFLSWDHPMVIAAMDLVLDEGFGQADCQVVSLAELPDGLAIVEATHVLDCAAPRLARRRALSRRRARHAPPRARRAGLERDARGHRHRLRPPATRSHPPPSGRHREQKAAREADRAVHEARRPARPGARRRGARRGHRRDGRGARTARRPRPRQPGCARGGGAGARRPGARRCSGALEGHARATRPGARAVQHARERAMKIVSFNVNSVRLRLHQLQALVDHARTRRHRTPGDQGRRRRFPGRGVARDGLRVGVRRAEDALRASPPSLAHAAPRRRPSAFRATKRMPRSA